MQPQVETGNPTSEGCQPPARARTFEQPVLFRAAQKIPCYVPANIKIRRRTDYWQAFKGFSGASTMCLIAWGENRTFTYWFTGCKRATNDHSNATSCHLS